MGNICPSYNRSTSAATVKLILQNGDLREFSSPVKVSQVLQDDSTSFVCDSDEMDFGEFVSAVDENEELQLGQLYFVLPLTCLNRPVPPEEMAALALKASEAFRKMRGSGGGGGGGGGGIWRARCCGVEGVETLEFAIKRKDVNKYRWVADTVGSGGGDSGDRQEFVSRRRRRRTGGCRVGRQRFVAELSAIEEE